LVDGKLRGGELSKVTAHLADCAKCELHLRELRSVRSSLQDLSQPKVPGSLRSRLRVTASQERSLLLESNGSPFRRLWTNWKLRLDEMMRPLTIPATGGLCSSLILWGVLGFTINTTTQDVAYDVPVMYADHMPANLVPVELRESVVLTLSLDGSGRITDYAVRDHSGSFIGDVSRLRGNNISVPDIPSVMAMRQPISSDIRISFTPMVFRP
jgi:hypothetical protein